MSNYQLSSLCLFKEIAPKSTNTCKSTYMYVHTCTYIFCDSQIESIDI